MIHVPVMAQMASGLAEELKENETFAKGAKTIAPTVIGKATSAMAGPVAGHIASNVTSYAADAHPKAFTKVAADVAAGVGVGLFAAFAPIAVPLVLIFGRNKKE